MMKRNMKTIAAILTVSAISGMSQAQSVVGNEDFESYVVGTWTNVGYVFGGDGLDIQDSGTVRGNELKVSLDLNAQYNSGFGFDMAMSGNVSRDINDYEMEFYLKIDPATWPSLTIPGSTGFDPNLVLTLYNQNAGVEGTELQVYGVTNYGNAVTNGDVLVCTFTPENVYTRWDKTEHLTADIPVWTVDLNYGFNGGIGTNGAQPIVMMVDSFVVRYIPPPLVNPEGAPVGYQTTNDLTLTGITLDGSAAVDIMELHLDGSWVLTTSNMAADTSTVTNIITYDALGLAAGLHSAAVKAYDTTGTNTVWHEWTFYCSGPPSPAETNPLGVYNINIGGTEGGNAVYYWPLTNGFVAAAPELGANNWLNVNYDNPWWFGNKNYQVSESSGSGSMGDIEYEMLSSSAYIGTYAILPWDGFHMQFESFQLACSESTIWGGALAGPGADNKPDSGNMDFELRNLDDDLTYDLYLYFVTQGDTAGTQTVYTLTTGYAPTMTASLTGDESSVWSNNSVVVNTFIEGTNYTTITDITPVGGVIGFNLMAPQGGSAGLSALQLAVRKPEVAAFSIQSIDPAASTVSLSWDSQQHITYNILGKSDHSASWNAISNNIPASGTGTNTVSVPMTPGESEEFYMIEAN